MLSLDNLRQPISRAEALERVLELMQSLGFDTTGWQEGRIQRTLITLFATIMADMSEVNRVIADAGFNEFATGKMLELFSNSRYQNQKFAARATSGLIPLTSTATTAYPIADGELIAATDNGVEFRSVGAYTIAANATTNVRFTARVKGADGNVGTNTIVNLLTPLAGVTIINPGDPWYDVSGVDLESDASLRLRNSTQWSRLSVELIAGAYENIARDNGAAKVKVNDENPRGAGTVDVYVAGEYAKLSNAEVTVIQEAFAARAFQTDSDWPPAFSSRVIVKQPLTQAPTISGTLYHDPGVASSVILERAYQALRDFLAVTPLGGWDYSPGPANVIMYSDLIDVLKDVEGVYTVNLSNPVGNISVGALTLVKEGNWAGLTAVPQISN
jgi:uncharacterized phage protein gp47/JayE